MKKLIIILLLSSSIAYAGAPTKEGLIKEQQELVNKITQAKDYIDRGGQRLVEIAAVLEYMEQIDQDKLIPPADANKLFTLCAEENK